MKQEDLLKQIQEIEKELALLPIGSITIKKIRDKNYYYHRVTENGKRNEKFIPFDEVEELKQQITKRKKLEKQLKKLQSLTVSKQKKTSKKLSFRTTVLYGDVLKTQISLIKNYKKRKCIDELRNYIFKDQLDKVFIIYGLRRTGKTTMIRQTLAELSPEEFNKAAFIQIKPKDNFQDLDEDLRKLQDDGFKYVFIDEVTLLEDFIEGAAIFADVYASSGMKIVLSGTDSLGFLFTKEEQLYDRCKVLHATFIPYKEFEEVLGIKGIDEYIQYGGTMSLSGINYNLETPFSSARNAEEYIDTAIAKNIQHSLKMYQDGGHFRQLLDLYEKGELTNVINRVVENINHSFTRKVVERTFESHDISITARNLLNDREKRLNIKEHINLDTVTAGIMMALDILNIEEQTIEIENAHMIQIKEYLKLLDLIMEIDLEYLPDVSKKNTITIISQPGLRYAQANAIVENLINDAKFQELSIIERQRVIDRLLSEIRGRMMEEIVLLETKIARPNKKVFKLMFAVGEFDMVVFDPKDLSCEIYEIKHSDKQEREQYRHITNVEKCAMTSHRFGEIKERYVIYRGNNQIVDNVHYLNVEEYLKSLY